MKEPIEGHRRKPEAVVEQAANASQRDVRAANEHMLVVNTCWTAKAMNGRASWAERSKEEAWVERNRCTTRPNGRSGR
jgi:hypothetical protein